jgi:hypothetical protein
MANIPLANIPNAPQTGNTAVMTDPSAIRPPNFRRGGAMIAEGVNMLRQEKLPAAAFDAGGMGAGLESLGNAGSNAASAFGDFAVRLGRANDEAQIAELDAIKTDLLTRFEEETLTKPADQWGDVWAKYDAQLVDKASKLPMSSPLSASKRDMAVKSLRMQTAAEVRGKANKARVESYRQSMQNYIDRAVNQGRYEDAMSGYKRGAVAGLWTDEVAEEGIIKIEEEQKVNTMTQAIQQNPAMWREELKKYQTSGKNPHGLRPEQVLQFRRMAEGTHAQLLDDLNNEMLENLETNSAAVTNDQIEEFYKRPEVDAPRELINKLKEYRDFKYADTPEGKADKATSYSDLWQAIFSYDAATDVSMADPDTHKREYQKLQQRIIESAPEGERKPFLDTLNDMVSQANQGQKSRTDEISRGLMQQADKLAEWGQFGQTGDWKKEKRGDVEVTMPKDVNAWLNVQSKRLEVTNEIRRLMRENPDLTVEQAQERFKGIVEPYLDPAASFMQKPEEEEGWMKALWDVATWGDFVMNPTANNPNVMAAGVSWGSRSLTEGLVDADEPLPPVQSMPPQPSATPAAIVASMPPAKQPIASEIASMAESEGLGQFTPHLMLLVAQESNFNPDQTISTSSARGLFQLLNADRKRYGSDSSLQGQIRAGLAKTKDNITAARKALGRDPDPFELYVVHYQGIGAGPAILKNPDGDFRATLDATGGKGHAARVMKANPWLVRDGVNTNQDFINWVRKRLSSKASQLGMA